MTPCEHTVNVQIKMPALHGGANPDSFPFVWCRNCGALWLPRLPPFTRAFERHEKEESFCPIDGLNVEGYWIKPGLGAIITLPSGGF